MDNLYLDLRLVDLGQGVGQSLDGALNVGLNNQVELLEVGLIHSLEEVLERDVRAALLLGLAALECALIGQSAGLALVLEHAELVAGIRHGVQALNLGSLRGAHGGNALAVLAEHGTHAAIGKTGDDGVAHMQGAALHEHGRNGAAAAVELCLEDVAGSEGLPVGLKLHVVGLQQDSLEQLVDADALLGGNVDEHVLSAPLLGDDAVLDELLAHAVGVGGGLVNLVDSNHDGRAGGVGVVDGLDGLRHDAVVGGNHENDDVGDLCTTSTHGGKCLVTRSVDKGDLAAVDDGLRGADVLCNAAGLA